MADGAPCIAESYALEPRAKEPGALGFVPAVRPDPPLGQGHVGRRSIVIGFCCGHNTNLLHCAMCVLVRCTILHAYLSIDRFRSAHHMR